MKNTESLPELNAIHVTAARAVRILDEFILGPVRQHRIAASIMFLLVFAVFVGQAIRTGYVYDARASLLISPPAYQKQGTGSEFMPETFDIPSYARLLRGGDILQAVCDRVLKERPDLWQEVYDKDGLTPEALERNLWISTEIVAKTPQAVSYSNVLLLTARSKDPEQAEHLMSAWLEEGCEAANRFTVPGSEATVKFIREESDKARNELEKREDALVQQQTLHDIELLDAVLQVKKERITEVKNELMVINALIEEKRGELTVLEASVAKEDEIKVIRHHPSVETVTLMEGVTGRTVTPDTTPMWITETLNTVRLELEKEKYTAEKELRAAEMRKAYLEEELKALEEEVPNQHAQLVSLTMQEERLQRDVETSKAYFDSLALEREKMAAIESSAEMAQASAVTVANRPVLPRKPQNALTRWAGLPIGLLIALAAGVAWAAVLSEFQRVRALSTAVENEKEEA